MVNIVLGIATYVLLIGLIIWLYFIYPWYLGKHLKYESELQKAQRISNFGWFEIDSGDTVFYRGKIDCNLILEEILKMLIKCSQNQYDKNIDILLKENKYRLLDTQTQINVVFSMYLQQVNPDPYEAYFRKYKMRSYSIERYIYPKVKTLKVLSLEELDELGMSKYIEKS